MEVTSERWLTFHFFQIKNLEEGKVKIQKFDCTLGIALFCASPTVGQSVAIVFTTDGLFFGYKN